MYWIAFMFGVLVTFVGIVIESVIPSRLSPNGFTASALIGGLLVGLIEESFKFVPYALFVYHKKYFCYYVDGVVLFIMVGLGSAFLEDANYIVTSGPSTGFVRLPFVLFHAATIALPGYFLIKAKIKHQKMTKTMLTLLFMVILHGFFDFSTGANKLAFALTALAIAIGLIRNLFVVYGRAKKADNSIASFHSKTTRVTN